MAEIEHTPTHESIEASQLDFKTSADGKDALEEFEVDSSDGMPQRSRLRVFAILVARNVRVTRILPLWLNSHARLAFSFCGSIGPDNHSYSYSVDMCTTS